MNNCEYAYYLPQIFNKIANDMFNVRQVRFFGINELSDSFSAEEAANHPRKNILMKALGANDPIEADIFDCDKDIDGIFLCSDGATNMLDTEQMEKVLYSELDIEEKIVKLIHKCNNRGGLDNISIALLLKNESGVAK